MVCLCFHYKQKFCLVYTEAVTDVVTMRMLLKTMETSKPELKMQRLHWHLRGSGYRRYGITHTHTPTHLHTHMHTTYVLADNNYVT